jgi:hypothetical protein
VSSNRFLHGGRNCTLIPAVDLTDGAYEMRGSQMDSFDCGG